MDPAQARSRQGQVRRLPGERSGESVTTEIDVARLADWMDSAALPGKGEPLTARFLSGGTQNVIYELRRGEEQCVLRMPPPGAPPDRDKGILREWRIIEALDGTEVPHTKAVGVCSDASVLGPPVLPDGFRRRLVADGSARQVAGAVRHRPRAPARGWSTNWPRALRCCPRSTGRQRGCRISAARTASTNARSTGGQAFSNGSRAANSTASMSPPTGCARTGRSTSSPA